VNFDNGDKITYKRIVVKYFHDDFRRIVGNAVRVSVNLDRVKDERLIPRRADRFPQALGRLTVVEKHDASKRICTSAHSRQLQLFQQE